MYLSIYVLSDSAFLYTTDIKPKFNGVGALNLRYASLLYQRTVGAKKPHSFVNLKEIVHLQHMGLN